MKKETYLKIKSKKRKARLLAIITVLSMIGCAIKENKEIEEMQVIDIRDEYTICNTEAIEIVDKNGSLYPLKSENFIETNYDVFAKMSIQLYDSYKQDKEVIGIIPEYQWLNRTFVNDEYSYVTTENGMTGYVHNDLVIELPNNYVDVDLSEQRVIVVDNNEIVLNCEVVTGKPGRETNIGYTDIWAKTYNRALTGPGYSRDVKYAFFFNDCEEAFHDATWRSEFGGNIYETNGSLGCVNMNLEDVKIMDEHTEVGTKVLVHK